MHVLCRLAGQLTACHFQAVEVPKDRHGYGFRLEELPRDPLELLRCDRFNSPHHLVHAEEPVEIHFLPR